ncbi:BTAD domain-containing putative transcriptional regulator [Caldilinea sp.]|uniref:AfsR/SARP family transcriptional regulator n=1 Tax=Caldilinea sp. TaxID=2293560 RepID=UPI002B62D64A|nr:hypothetical protein [Anaerolineales bacterium]HQY94811.1 BTAD domain-containing putative transcriptional regulator [Caldilinea sp.]HRA68759.1 BTAD domain-containing putative transcriptional regulator [Caldilinea sp.]
MNPHRVVDEVKLHHEYSIYTFGGLKILRDGVDLSAEMPAKVGALTAYLACEPGCHPRNDLCDLLWGGRRLTSGATNLRVALTTIRRLVGSTITIARYVVCIAPETALWMDARQLQAAVAPLLPGRDSGDVLSRQAVQQIERVLALYRGDFLQGIALANAPHFEAWVKYQQAKFRTLIYRACAALSNHYWAVGDYGSGIEAAQRWTVIDPLDDRAQRTLMQLYAEADRMQDALQSYGRYQDLLRDVLQIAPSRDMQLLHRSLLRLSGSPDAAAREAMPASINLGARRQAPRHHLETV